MKGEDNVWKETETQKRKNKTTSIPHLTLFVASSTSMVKNLQQETKRIAETT